MKKIFHYAFLLVGLGGLLSLSSCGTDPEPTAVLPDPDGTVLIDLLNYPGASPAITAKAGDIIAVAVKMTKSPTNSNRPQKLRVYETQTLNTRGTPVGSTIDLRNQDEQTKNINYTVPAITGPVYLYFEVDESGGKFSRKVLTINVGTVGAINTWTDVVLGASGNTLAGTLGSSTGQTYTVAGGATSDAAENIADVDITYIASTDATGPWLTSYPARSQAPFSLNATITGASATYFAGTALTVDQFNAITTSDALVTAVGTAPSTNQYYPHPSTSTLKVGDVVKFKNGRSKVGLVKVVAITAGNSGTIKIDVKVQR